jgi:hypothetical protein
MGVARKGTGLTLSLLADSGGGATLAVGADRQRGDGPYTSIRLEWAKSQRAWKMVMQHAATLTGALDRAGGIEPRFKAGTGPRGKLRRVNSPSGVFEGLGEESRGDLQ